MGWKSVSGRQHDDLKFTGQGNHRAGIPTGWGWPFFLQCSVGLSSGPHSTKTAKCWFTRAKLNPRHLSPISLPSAMCFGTLRVTLSGPCCAEPWVPLALPAAKCQQITDNRSMVVKILAGSKTIPCFSRNSTLGKFEASFLRHFKTMSSTVCDSMENSCWLWKKSSYLNVWYAGCLPSSAKSLLPL
jgi:hypothetical protein